MALGVPRFVRIGAVIAGCALVAACTLEPGPTITPTPVPSSASLTPSATPTETEIERQQRLDFEAAEKAYRASIAEQDRLASLGVSRSTAELERTSTGRYLEVALLALSDLEKAGWRTRNSSRIVGVARGGWQEARLTMTACEDGSGIEIVDKSGRDVTPDVGRRFVQNLTIVRVQTTWKVSSSQSERVESFRGEPCAP